MQDKTRLDPEDYRQDSEAYRIATVLSEEVEATRALVRTTEKPRPASLLSDTPVYRSDYAPWTDFADDLGLLLRAAARLSMSPRMLATKIIEKYRPENWKTFFWIGQWFEVQAQLGADDLARQEAIEAAKREAISTSVRRANDASHRENRELKRIVQEHYLANQSSFKSKNQAAEQMAGKLVPMPFRTVRDWLTRL